MALAAGVTAVVGALVTVAAAIYALCAAPAWVASGELPRVLAVLEGAARLPGTLNDPAAAFDPEVARLMPSAAAWWLVVALVWVAGVALGLRVWVGVDGLRARRRIGLRSYDPRRWVRPRSWARPRDLAHLRTGVGDSWTMLRLDRRLIGTEPQTHVLMVAPTGAGKTTGPVTTWLLEHDGPALVTSSKTDVLALTLGARLARGPVWVYAPLVPADSLPVRAAGWTPLAGCGDWEYAKLMGRWLAAAESGGDGQSDGARFYRHAAAQLIGPLLHAAALGDRRMGEVLQWVEGRSLEPIDILRAQNADAAARAVQETWNLDDRARSLTTLTARQLLDAFSYPSVQRVERPDIDPARLLEGCGTLYMIAPESLQEITRPLFAGLLSAVFRECELRANRQGPLDPTLRVVLDETRRLAAVDDLPGLLSVCRSWGVRVATVWQGLGQIEQRYGQASDEVLGNSLAKLLLGPLQDEETRRYFVELLDEERHVETSYDVAGPLGRTARQQHDRERDKASAQTLQQLGRGEGVYLHGRDLPAKGRVQPYWERSDLKEAIAVGDAYLAGRRERANGLPVARSD
ncbi:type IV secretory system conjugative DNA transfer family protein [Conexibacter sp. W3-3-2]|uniref:type IV secretory system conjugative DNA transfer family protein n=1 Tax=Conexibacter sp. W3-3-2 TaxID=2675227 RepID=UPI001E5DC45E|nr:type IV secretory system conjugative DNA transfer family protein [Conexibacter sp. W3-3-2]